MDLKNLKVNFMGDSITFGEGVSDKEQLYWNLLKRECGLAEARCYAVSGTQIAKQTFPETPEAHQDFLSRVDEMDPDADLIVVMGGTNDFGYGDAPLGSMTDLSPYTFYGACHKLIQKLMLKYPEARILMATPIHRMIEGRWDRTLRDYVEAIRRVSEYYGVPVADLYATCQIQPQLEDNRNRFCPDGLHPNEAGHRRIYECLRARLESL